MRRIFALFIAAARLHAASSDTAPAAPAGPSVLEEFMMPKVTATYFHDFRMSLPEGRGGFSIDELALSAPVAALVKSDAILVLANLNYRLFSTDLSTGVTTGKFDLHTLRVPLQAAWMPEGSSWFLFALLAPGISTDFGAINRESFDLTASLDLGYQVSRDLVVAVGAYYSRDYGEDLLLPGIGLLWRPLPEFTLEISPNGFIPEWRIQDGWRLRGLLSPMGGRWTVHDHGAAKTLRITGAKAGVEFEHRLAAQCWATVGVGANVMQHIHIEDGRKSELLNEDVSGGLYVGGAVTWRF